MLSSDAPETHDARDPRVYCAILAGGAGTRLWPLSVPGRPKFLLDLTGAGRSLLAQAHERARLLSPDEKILVVTAAGLLPEVAAELPALPSGNLLGEPVPRDSSAAVGLAAAEVLRRDPEGVLVVLPADQVIAPPVELLRATRSAVAAAREGQVCAVAVRATAPSTAYGYIRLGDPRPASPGAWSAAAFVEKPGPERAEQLYGDGQHVWNAGIYVARADVVLERLAAYTPGWDADLHRLAERATAPDPALWAAQPKVAFDYSVSEPGAAAGLVSVVPAELDWRDLGDWTSVREALGAGETESLHVLGDPGMVFGDGTGLVVAEGGRPVVVLGVQDVVVVDAPDGLLVMSTAHAQRLRQAVGEVVAAQAEGDRAEGNRAEGNRVRRESR